MDDCDDRISKLDRFLELLDEWENTHDRAVRAELSKTRRPVMREVAEAGCLHTLTIGPPPAVGGMIMRNVNPFNMIFEEVYLESLNRHVRDMVHATIGVLETQRDNPQPEVPAEKAPTITSEIQKGYVFVAMPIGPENPFDDVLDAIKETCHKCGLLAERVDEAESNERITDRILESIQKAEYVVVDLTEARPNVFYEAGYAHGIDKLPIYIARTNPCKQ